MIKRGGIKGEKGRGSGLIMADLQPPNCAGGVDAGCPEDIWVCLVPIEGGEGSTELRVLVLNRVMREQRRICAGQDDSFQPCLPFSLPRSAPPSPPLPPPFPLPSLPSPSHHILPHFRHALLFPSSPSTPLPPSLPPPINQPTHIVEHTLLSDITVCHPPQTKVVSCGGYQVR